MCTTCGCGPNDLNGHHHDHDHDGHHHDHKHGHHKHTHHTDGHGEHQAKGTRTVIAIEEDILAKNNRLASLNRTLFKDKGIFVLNLVSSPGSGKTTLLERTLRDLNGKFQFAVIEGDQQTDNDAQRIAATGVPVRQINTGSGCHLDAHMVMHGSEGFDLDNLNNGATEVIMLRFDPEAAGQVTVRLSYFDIRRQRTVQETQTASLRIGNGRNFLQDPEVRKNFTIANIAQALSDMQTFWKNSNYRAAESMLRAAVSETHERYPRMEDEDIRSQLNVAENYLSTLHQFNSGRGGLSRFE